MKIEGNWLAEPALQALLSLVSTEAAPARVNGGAVRNALLGEPVADVDVSTVMLPQDVVVAIQGAGHKAVPTGIDHGTITAVVDGHAYEVTTLRRDVATDGRRAVVAYTDDWREDALRRDLTMNALYCGADGTVFDPLDGLADLQSRTVRFIEDAETRINEDYLRILRFFRFFAWYGRHRPDAAGLKACAKLKDGMDMLSVERIWAEFSKLLAAPDPTRAVLWMRTTGVLAKVLPEGDRWGIDSLAPFVELEWSEGWEPDAVLRMMAILPPDVERMKGLAARLKLPNTVRDRLTSWAGTTVPRVGQTDTELAKALYVADRSAVADRTRLAMIDPATRDDLRTLLATIEAYEKPAFPLRGGDLIDAGMSPGPAISQRLAELEKRWVDSDFTLSAESLLEG